MNDTLQFAVDRSLRRIDQDGRLHVEVTNLSKANVCPYRGSEIPNAAALGLEADKIYYLLRDPEELSKAAASANNIPVMDEHIIVTAENPNKTKVAGSTGTDAKFVAPYLQNSIVIWVQESIDRIMTGEQKQISMAYRYDPVLKSGSHNGVDFQMIMTNIRFNHCALVPEGRAGPDVMVADGKLGDIRTMRTSKTALMVRGAVSGYLAPLALDSKPDLTKALAGVTAKTFASLKPTVINRIAADAKLTADQTAGLALALDAMEEEEVDGEDEMEEMTEAEKEAADKKAKDKRAKDKAAKDKAAKDKKAKDESDKDDDKKAEDEDDDDKKAEDEDQDERAEKAMDAAIKKAVRAAEDRLNALAKAKDDVAPYVGSVHGMDSAEAVYRFALDSAGHNTKAIKDVAALEAMVKMLPKPGAQPTIALDAKSRDNVSELFPNLSRYA